MSSWVSFWLVKTDKGRETPARTQLGATTVLAVVTIGFGGKAKPQVGYATALDVFTIICFASVFSAFIEFSFINFLDMFIRRLKHRDKVRYTILDAMTTSMTAPLVPIKDDPITRAMTRSSTSPLVGDRKQTMARKRSWTMPNMHEADQVE